MSEKNQDDTIDIINLMRTLLDHKWWIIISTLVTTVIGAGYAFFATPIYLAHASIQIEEKSHGRILPDFAGILEEKSSSNTEIAILKSRMVLSYSVNQLNLTTEITPHFSLPLIGKMMARLSNYEPELQVYYFSPLSDDAHSVILEVGDNPNTYSLFSDATSEKLLEGKIGEIYESDRLHFAVSMINAEAGQRFKIKKISELSAISKLKDQLSISEAGKQTGIIDISTQGENKNHIRNIITSVAESYLSQNVARNSAEASKSLAFLNKQLPEIREKLSDAENKLNAFRLKNESLDLSFESRSTLESIVRLESELNELKTDETEISQKFTRNHPAYVALIKKRNVLNAEKERLNKQVERLPNTQKEIIRLTRDLEVNQQIYIQLLNRIQELDVVKASTIGNVRMLDTTQVFPEPVAPKKSLIILMSLILGLALSSLAIMIKGFLSQGIESTAEIEKSGLSTYAVIPHSERQPKVSLKNMSKGKNALLSDSHPDDNAVEALRSLRTSLYFAMQEAQNNIVMISGTVPSVGKSFISTNLANILAKTGKKVLLIDADLRRSYLDSLLSLKHTQGLSESITQDMPFESAVNIYENFSVMTKGKTPKNPSELFYSARFQQLLDWASQNYDIVLIDTPPILSVTDAAIIGKYAGTVLLVGYFAKTTVKEVETAKARFEQAGITTNGFILNGARPRASNYYEHYGYKS
ncbi:polysaccharide biosynthesis tyrosine autokinase [Bisgaard Taxon 46]